MTSCTDCGTVWHGLTECHCATCHRHFGSIRAFDEHRVGPVDTRSCADLETLRTKTGRKPLMATLRGSRPVWVSSDTREHPKVRERKAPATGSGNGGEAVQ